jgi:hypothetical protein
VKNECSEGIGEIVVVCLSVRIYLLDNRLMKFDLILIFVFLKMRCRVVFTKINSINMHFHMGIVCKDRM